MRASSALADVTTAKARTDRAKELEGKIEEIAKRQRESDAPITGNPTEKTLATLFFDQIHAAKAGTWQQIAMAVFAEFVIAGAFLLAESMKADDHGGQSNQRRSMLRRMFEIFNRKNRTKKGPSELAIVEDVQHGNIKQLKVQRPKLVSSRQKPTVAVLEFAREVLEDAPGERLELDDVYFAHAARCASEGREPIMPAEFIPVLKRICTRLNIELGAEDAKLYMLSVRMRSEFVASAS